VALSVYADASLLVALFTPDAFSDRAEAYLDAAEPILRVSDFASAELASALSRKVRTRERTEPQVRDALVAFDTWTARRGPRLETLSSDIVLADSFLRRLDLALRTPDAVNLAIAKRFDLALATFDVRMAATARAVGLEVAPA
jgi:predicted nucleic acid-binding protein